MVRRRYEDSLGEEYRARRQAATGQQAAPAPTPEPAKESSRSDLVNEEVAIPVPVKLNVQAKPKPQARPRAEFTRSELVNKPVRAQPIPRRHPIHTKPRPKKLWPKFAIVSAILLGVGLLAFFYFKPPASPIPVSIRQAAKFQLYYPKKLPGGYAFDKTSAKIDGSIVFITFRNGGRQILITQQPVPANPPNLKSLTAFGELTSSIGQAVGGDINGLPVAIVLTKSSLINLSGSKDVSQEEMAAIVQSLSAVR